MDMLLDSHALLWFLQGNTQMPEVIVNAIHSTKNNIYISIASIWEIGIKLSTGKLKLNGGIDSLINNINENGFAVLEIIPSHIKTVVELPFLHRDPFDRIIIAQAITEDLQIITIDENIKKYNVKATW
jgi:PIN domain nuclease of toxin-antitoxin system